MREVYCGALMIDSNFSLFIPSPSSVSTSYSQFLSPREKGVPLMEWIEGDPLIDQEFFKRFISCYYHSLYLRKKKQNRIYQILFFSFGILFSFFALLMFFHTTNPASHLFFTNGVTMKYCMNYGCLLLSAGAFGAGCLIQPEKEAKRELVDRIQQEFYLSLSSSSRK